MADNQSFSGAANTRLTVEIGGEQRTVVAGQTLTIGREPECDWTVTDRLVSRHHAIVAWQGAWYLTDMSSTNGTFADGLEVSRIRVDGTCIVYLGGPSDGTLVSLTVDPGPETSSVVIGRDPSADIVIPDPLLSRRHCLVTWNGPKAVVEDLESRNGTYVNGTLVRTAALTPGDQLTVGNTDIDVDQSGALMLRPDATRTGLVLRSVSYATPEGKVLLTDVNLNAPPSSIIGVIGPSGSGKSTLVNVITGLREPSTGNVSFEGHDVHGEYASMKTRIGFVPQDDLIHRQLSVSQAFEYAARLRFSPDTSAAEREARVAEVIDMLGLAAHQHTPIKRLSGGQRKRASIGLELITQPALLVLDEPTSGLDPGTARDLMSTLQSLANSGRTVVVITHSPTDLDQCDMVVLLAAGGLVAGVSSPAGLLAQFRTSDWRDVYHESSSETGDPERVHEYYVRDSALSALSHPPPLPVGQRPATPTGSSPRRTRQLRTLVARQWRLLTSDRGYFAFLLILPVTLGALAFITPGQTGFGELLEARQVLVMLVLGASFSGLALSVRDLVTERSIYQRERAVGLRPTAYIGSKVIVFGAMGFVQATLLTTVVLSRKSAPTDPLVLGNGGLELFAAVLLTLWSCCALGLVVSSLVRTNEQVLPVLVLCVMIQLVFSGGMTPISGRPVLTQIAWFIPARWGYSAAADTVDLQALAESSVRAQLPAVPQGASVPVTPPAGATPPEVVRPQFTDPDMQFDHLSSQWLKCIAILIVLTVVFTLLALWRVRDKKHRSRKSPVD